MKRKILAVVSLLTLTLSLAGCGDQSSGGQNSTNSNRGGSKTTIIDDVTLYETTFDEVFELWDDKNLVYGSHGTTVSDEFLGHDCWYAIGDDDDDSTVDYVTIHIAFHDDDEVKQGNNDITTYLEKKLISEYDEGIKYDNYVDESYNYACIYPIDTLEEGSNTAYICVMLEKYCADSEDEVLDGYSLNYFKLKYFGISKEEFIERYVEGKGATPEADASDVEEVEEETAEEAEAEEAESTSTDDATTQTSQEEMYLEISKKFFGSYTAEGEDPNDSDSKSIVIHWLQIETPRTDFLELYEYDRGSDWVFYDENISYDGTTVTALDRNSNEMVELTYVDENTVLYRGTKYVRDTAYNPPINEEMFGLWEYPDKSVRIRVARLYDGKPNIVITWYNQEGNELETEYLYEGAETVLEVNYEENQIHYSETGGPTYFIYENGKLRLAYCDSVWECNKISE